MIIDVSDGQHGVKVCDDLGKLREFLNIQNYSLPSQKLYVISYSDFQHHDNIQEANYKEERFVIVHDPRGFNPLL